MSDYGMLCGRCPVAKPLFFSTVTLTYKTYERQQLEFIQRNLKKKFGTSLKNVHAKSKSARFDLFYHTLMWPIVFYSFSKFTGCLIFGSFLFLFITSVGKRRTKRHWNRMKPSWMQSCLLAVSLTIVCICTAGKRNCFFLCDDHSFLPFTT